MEAFSELFEAMIRQHGDAPRNFGELAGATHRTDGINPLTGDYLVVEAVVDQQDCIAQIQFSGKGSTLAVASASIMTGELEGKTRQQALEKIETTRQIFEQEDGQASGEFPDNDYQVLLEIRHFPHRTRCAFLAWATAKRALEARKAR